MSGLRRFLLTGIVVTVAGCSPPPGFIRGAGRLAHDQAPSAGLSPGYEVQGTAELPSGGIQKRLSRDHPRHPTGPLIPRSKDEAKVATPRIALLEEVNRVRRLEGLPPLALDSRLNNTAWLYAWQMGQTGRGTVRDAGNESLILSQLGKHGIDARRAGLVVFRLPTPSMTELQEVDTVVKEGTKDREGHREDTRHRHRVGTLVKAAVRDWLASPPSRFAVLSPRFTKTGIAVIEAKDGAYLVAQIFTGP